MTPSSIGFRFFTKETIEESPRLFCMLKWLPWTNLEYSRPVEIQRLEIIEDVIPVRHRYNPGSWDIVIDLAEGVLDV